MWVQRSLPSLVTHYHTIGLLTLYKTLSHACTIVLIHQLWPAYRQFTPLVITQNNDEHKTSRNQASESTQLRVTRVYNEIHQVRRLVFNNLPIVSSVFSRSLQLAYKN